MRTYDLPDGTTTTSRDRALSAWSQRAWKKGRKLPLRVRATGTTTHSGDALLTGHEVFIVVPEENAPTCTRQRKKVWNANGKTHTKIVRSCHNRAMALIILTVPTDNGVDVQSLAVCGECRFELAYLHGTKSITVMAELIASLEKRDVTPHVRKSIEHNAVMKVRTAVARRQGNESTNRVRRSFTIEPTLEI